MLGCWLVFPPVFIYANKKKKHLFPVTARTILRIGALGEKKQKPELKGEEELTNSPKKRKKKKNKPEIHQINLIRMKDGRKDFCFVSSKRLVRFEKGVRKEGLGQKC